MNNIFKADTVELLVSRINKLSKESQPLWGKMNFAQMLAHCNITYEMIFTDKHPKPKGFIKIFLKLFIKKLVTGDKPYKRSSQTAPAFLIIDERDFSQEKERLIAYIKQVKDLGEVYFDGKESLSFGKLKATEWNNMFYKHLDHHLKQFGV
jgi:hypothetical protein